MVTKQQLKSFLNEDAPQGDVTSLAIFGNSNPVVKAELIAKEPLVLSGLGCTKILLKTYFPKIKIKAFVKDGGKVRKGKQIAELKGPVQDILLAERLLLNIMQRMSGVASLTAEFVSKLGSSKVQVLDARKTTPGLRALQRQAVLDGGAYNHRWGLSDQYLIKENHITAAGSITIAIQKVKEHKKKKRFKGKVEVEVQNVKEFEEALTQTPDIIMLDNMNKTQIKRCVALRNKAFPKKLKRPELEVSGGITLKTIQKYGRLGVERVSVGALTHSAKSSDISLLVHTN